MFSKNKLTSQKELPVAQEFGEIIKTTSLTGVEHGVQVPLESRPDSRLSRTTGSERFAQSTPDKRARFETVPLENHRNNVAEAAVRWIGKGLRTVGKGLWFLVGPVVKVLATVVLILTGRMLETVLPVLTMMGGALGGLFLAYEAVVFLLSGAWIPGVVSAVATFACFAIMRAGHWILKKLNDATDELGKLDEGDGKVMRPISRIIDRMWGTTTKK